jgi:hypothetical protein
LFSSCASSFLISVPAVFFRCPGSIIAFLPAALRLVTSRHQVGLSFENVYFASAQLRSHPIWSRYEAGKIKSLF